MTAATHTIILLVFTSLGVISVESQEFWEVPMNTCLPCGGQVKFNCTTVANHTIFVNGMSSLREGPGGQLWRIQTTNGTTESLCSTTPDKVPTNYKFIETFPNSNEFTGILVSDTDSSWSGTTFQCIAFTPANTEEINDASEPATLEVGGSPQKFSCQCQCPDAYHSDRCNITWDRLHNVSCNSLQINVSLTLSNGTPVYSENFESHNIFAQTTPLDLRAVYTATITAENECGITNCSTVCSPESGTGSTTVSSTVTPKQSPTSAPPTTRPTRSAGTIAGGVVCRIPILIAVIATFCF